MGGITPLTSNIFPRFRRAGSTSPSSISSDEVLSGGRLRKEESPLSQSWYRSKQRQISSNQKRTLREYWADFGIDLKYGKIIDVHSLFGSSSGRNAEEIRPLVMDIGFGMGESLLHMAANNPQNDYIGVEIHRAGVAQCLGGLVSEGLCNVRLIRADATTLLENHLPAACLDEVHVYFPDPWPNEYRDSERRIIRPKMVQLMTRLLRPGGVLRVATDVADYASHVEVVMKGFTAPGERYTWVQVDKETYAPLSKSRLRVRGLTKYEKRALDLKLTDTITEFLYRLESRKSEQQEV